MLNRAPGAVDDGIDGTAGNSRLFCGCDILAPMQMKKIEHHLQAARKIRARMGDWETAPEDIEHMPAVFHTRARFQRAVDRLEYHEREASRLILEGMAAGRKARRPGSGIYERTPAQKKRLREVARAGGAALRAKGKPWIK